MSNLRYAWISRINTGSDAALKRKLDPEACMITVKNLRPVTVLSQSLAHT